MTIRTMEYDGSTLYVVPYGPLTLVSTAPVTLEALDAIAAEDPLWDHLGLLVDPTRSGNSYDAVLHEIRLFMEFESSITGAEWELDPHLLASRIYLQTEPVVVPLWRDL